jgi:ribosomal protein S18 acetylase RimI-like enzyme
MTTNVRQFKWLTEEDELSDLTEEVCDDFVSAVGFTGNAAKLLRRGVRATMSDVQCFDPTTNPDRTKTLWVIEVDDKVSGCVIIDVSRLADSADGSSQWKTDHLNLWVREDQRGRGLARKLLDNASSTACRAPDGSQPGTLQLMVPSVLERAKKLYHAAGFRDQDSFVADYDTQPLEIIRMSKTSAGATTVASSPQ